MVKDYLRAAIRRRRGKNQELLKAIDEMSPEAVRQLHDILRDLELDVSRARSRARRGLGFGI